MVRVGIVGASGYTGGELTRILSLHPEVTLTVATSRQHAGRKLSDVYPHLSTVSAITCEDVDINDLVERADLFFTAVPHQTAMEIVPQFLEAGKKVVESSGKFRGSQECRSNSSRTPVGPSADFNSGTPSLSTPVDENLELPCSRATFSSNVSICSILSILASIFD